MKFPDFPTIEGYPCTDPDLFWGYACKGHVDLRQFRDECCKQHGEPPTFIYKNGEPYPGHAFVVWTGFGGWTFCMPDEESAKPITLWAADTCTYTQWLRQRLSDLCEWSRTPDEPLVLELVRTLRMFRYDGYAPALDAMYSADAS